MENIDLVTKLSFIIEKLTKAGDYKLANELSYLQLDFIEERTKAWNDGFNTAYGIMNSKDESGELKS